MLIYLGNYVSNHIKNKRGMPAYNPSCNNRMIRLSMAIKSAGSKIAILSPGISLRVKFNRKLIHKRTVEVHSKIPVIYCSALAIPFISVFWECFSEPYLLFKLNRKKKITGLLVYCFYPPHILTAFIARYFLKIPIILDLEDISIPRLSDWKKNTEVRPMQQLLAWPSMKAMILLSKSIIVPTKNFLSVLPNSKKVLVITGCLKVNPTFRYNKYMNGRINVLFSGKIEFEHGIDLLVDCFRGIALDHKVANKFIFHICGSGSKKQWLLEQITTLDNLKIKVHGFVSDTNYLEILNKSNICLALQNPNGRYAKFKTPSKAYEYIGNGKVTIVSDVGDFSELPTDTCIVLKPYTANNFLSVLNNIDREVINSISRSGYGYANKHWNLMPVGRKIISLLS